MVWFRGQHERHGRAGRCGSSLSDEGIGHTSEQGAGSGSDHPFPASLSPRPHDTDTRPLGHPPLAAESLGFAPAYPGRGEDAFHQGGVGNRGVGACLRDRLSDADHRHARGACRIDGEIRRWHHRWHRQRLWRQGEFRHHFHPTWRDHARCAYYGSFRRRPIGLVRLRR